MGCRFSGPWIGGETGVSGRHVSQLSKQDALRILAAYEQPITMQIKPRRHFRQNGNEAHGDRSWETLPLSLQNLSLPLQTSRPPASDSRGSPSSQDRHHWRHLLVQQGRCEEGMYEYLPTAPQDTIDMVGYQDKDLASRDPNSSSCLLGCCSNPAEPSRTHAQIEDGSVMAENPHGYLPLHHELDSGLGWTDGSIHQGELSGLETEEGGLDECHPYGRGFVPAGCAGHGFGRGSPSSESYVSSELSDSGFCSVSTGEFRRFQRLLEKRMRLYNARLRHPAEPCEKRERRDSCPKSHRELLEAIPEALSTMQPLLPHPQPGAGHGSDPATGLSPCGLSRVSSVQFRKEDQPCLNRHSSSSGALFNPPHGHTSSSMGMPVLSTCSTPSGHRRPAALRKQHQASNSVGVLRRSRTLHYRPPPHEYRRRASHPASPSYSTATLHSGDPVKPRGPEQRETPASGLALSHAARASSPHRRGPPPALSPHPQGARGPCCNSQLPHHEWPRERSLKAELGVPEEDRLRRARGRDAGLQKDAEKDVDLQAVRDEERQREFVGDSKSDPHCFHTLSLPPQPGDINETWPKPASRLSQGSGCGGGLYSTLALHTNPGPGAMSQWADNEKPNTICKSNTHAHSTHIANTNHNTRISRNQLLRNRASRLADERGGMSTDEETNTEMLQGRYWSRTERREHLLIAREQRQQQQQRARAAPMRDGAYNRGVAVEDGNTESRGRDEDQFFVEGRCDTVLELSQRKLNHLRNRKLYDDWTTVEELLTHGTRMDSRESVVCPSNLLTVTTV
ncbi:unnamed protein product [Lota lota]